MKLRVAPPQRITANPCLLLMRWRSWLTSMRTLARGAQLLASRRQRRAVDGFLAETAPVREDKGWRLALPASAYADRRAEIAGPTDRKIVTSALHSRARGLMVDFEEANRPTWPEQVTHEPAT